MPNKAYDIGLQSVGDDVVIWETTKVVDPQKIEIGDSVIIDDFTFLCGGSKTTIGSFIHIASFVSITGGGELMMEDFTGLSSGVRVFTGNEDYSGNCLTNPTVPYPYRIPVRSFIRIEKHAIVGANTVILPGVVVGEGAAIGANSLVTKDCKPWTVYFGSPAKAIKQRPKSKILLLEEKLKNEMYSVDGKYIPKIK